MYMLLYCVQAASVISSYLRGGGVSPESQIHPQKNTQNTKNIRKCIEFTSQICVPQNLESRINTDRPLPYPAQLPCDLDHKKYFWNILFLFLYRVNKWIKTKLLLFRNILNKTKNCFFIVHTTTLSHWGIFIYSETRADCLRCVL